MSSAAPEDKAFRLLDCRPMQPTTHPALDARLVGRPLELAPGRAVLELTTTREMAADRPYTVVARAMHIHPTVTELLPTLLQKLRPLG